MSNVEVGRRLFIQGGAAVGASAALLSARPVNALPVGGAVVNVREYQREHPGLSDREAVQAAVNRVASSGGGGVFLEPGTYAIDGTIWMPNVPVDVFGVGFSTIIDWSNDGGSLFEWRGRCAESSIKDIKIRCLSKSDRYSDTAAIKSNYTAHSVFDNIYFGFASGNSGFHSKAISLLGVVDTTNILNCIFWGMENTAIELGSGSEVRIIGGRLVGHKTRPSSGVHLTGGNGGVHISMVDIIEFERGIFIENAVGKQNREIFITHATIDGCWRGLDINDHAYVSVAGCWAASCDQDNIHVAPGYSGALLTISGGTIFNGGAAHPYPVSNAHNGVVVNSGSFSMNGVCVRNNKGIGVWVPSGSVRDYSISGCKIYGNKKGLVLNGSGYAVTGCVVTDNPDGNAVSGSGNVVVGNVGV